MNVRGEGLKGFCGLFGSTDPSLEGIYFLQTKGLATRLAKGWKLENLPNRNRKNTDSHIYTSQGALPLVL